MIVLGLDGSLTAYGYAFLALRAREADDSVLAMGCILTAHEAAEADAMRAALVDRLLWTAAMSSRSHEGAAFSSTNRARSAAWATVLWLLLAPEAT